MKLISSIVVATTLAFGLQAHADDAGKALAQKSGCLACHSVDTKVVGPAFKDVSAKYKGKGAEAKLVEKVKKVGQEYGVQFQCQQIARKLKTMTLKLSFLGC